MVGDTRAERCNRNHAIGLGGMFFLLDCINTHVIYRITFRWIRDFGPFPSDESTFGWRDGDLKSDEVPSAELGLAPIDLGLDHRMMTLESEVLNRDKGRQMFELIMPNPG
jgi:hypothetical protein